MEPPSRPRRNRHPSKRNRGRPRSFARMGRERTPSDCGGDPDSNDWNWRYELSRGEVPWRHQLIAEVVPAGEGASSCANDEGDEAIATTKTKRIIQIIDPAEEESHYWGDCPPNLRALDIWIGEEDCLGKGYGTTMMEQALSSYGFGKDDLVVEAVLVDPMATNLAAHRFYQRMGFKPIGLRWFGPDECLVHRLDRADYDNAFD